MERALAALGIGVEIWVTVWTFFDRVEGSLREDQVRSIAASLRRPDRFIACWPLSFITTFDALFGESHFGLKRLKRSVVASIFSAVFVSVLWAVWWPHEFIEFVADLYQQSTIAAATSLSIFLVWNIIPDFLSLSESRIILGVLATRQRFPWIAIIADVLATSFIAITCMTIYVLGFTWMSGSAILSKFVWIIWTLMMKDVFQASYHSMGIYVGEGGAFEAAWGDVIVIPPMFVLFYSTFLTSVWIWLYVLAGLFVTFVAYSRRGVKLLERIGDFENHPLRCLGGVAGGIFAIGYWLLAAADWV